MGAWLRRAGEAVERWLEAERDQLPLWLPVFGGLGVACWFLLPDARSWTAAMLAFAAVGVGGLAFGRVGRACRAIAIAGWAAAIGIGLIWWRAERVAAPVLGQAVTASFSGRVERVEPLAARGLVRLTIEGVSGGRDPWGEVLLPPKLRVNLQEADVPAGLAVGATCGCARG